MDWKEIIPIAIFLLLIGLIITSYAIKVLIGKNTSIIAKLLAVIVVAGVVGSIYKGYFQYQKKAISKWHLGKWTIATEDYKLIGEIEFQEAADKVIIRSGIDQITVDYSIDYKRGIIDGYKFSLEKLPEKDLVVEREKEKKEHTKSKYLETSFKDIKAKKGEHVGTLNDSYFLGNRILYNFEGIIRFEEKNKAFIKLHPPKDSSSISSLMGENGSSFYLNRIEN